MSLSDIGVRFDGSKRRWLQVLLGRVIVERDGVQGEVAAAEAAVGGAFVVAFFLPVSGPLLLFQPPGQRQCGACRGRPGSHTAASTHKKERGREEETEMCLSCLGQITTSPPLAPTVRLSVAVPGHAQHRRQVQTVTLWPLLQLLTAHTHTHIDTHTHRERENHQPHHLDTALTHTCTACLPWTAPRRSPPHPHRLSPADPLSAFSIV